MHEMRGGICFLQVHESIGICTILEVLMDRGTSTIAPSGFGWGRDQEAREERQRLRKERGSGFDLLPDDGLGSFDDGDPFTTNLYVGNLVPEVDEEVLRKEFARFGTICSVKVMWPRDDDQRRRGRNCGFVAYTVRT